MQQEKMALKESTKVSCNQSRAEKKERNADSLLHSRLYLGPSTNYIAAFFFLSPPCPFLSAYTESVNEVIEGADEHGERRRSKRGGSAGRKRRKENIIPKRMRKIAQDELT
jgi:hypothetical protein